MMTPGQKIRELRQAKNMSLNRLAKRSGVSKSYLSQLENGGSTAPSAEILMKIAKPLYTTISELLCQDTTVLATDFIDLPRGLGRLIRESSVRLDIREEDVKMLRQIHYRGSVPKLAEDWEQILQTIRLVVGARRK